MTLIGYARISTIDQDAALQHEALVQAGAVRIFTDTMSGAQAVRPELSQALDYLRAGDTLVVWKLDRLGRSLRDLIDQVSVLEGRGIGFRSLTEAIDTTTPGGQLFFHLMGAMAEFERDLLRERTRAGMASVRARGRPVGRPSVMTPERVKTARDMVAKHHSLAQVATTLGVSRSTIRRALDGAYDTPVTDSAGPGAVVEQRRSADDSR